MSTEIKVTTRLKNINKEELLSKLIELKNFTKVGKFYNVSDNAIRKKCMKLDLPSTSKEIKKLILSKKN